MKNSKLVKFSLTLVCAAILSACGSSGGSDNSAAEAEAKAKAEQAQQAEAAKKAAEEAAKKAAEEAENKVKNSAVFGHKLVKKTDSNFILNIEGENRAAKSSESTGRSDTMDVKLHPSLDTVVVSIPLDENGNPVKGAPIGYVEDFDFRGNTNNTTGEFTLGHIYKTANGATTSGQVRGVETDTKTATAGTDTGSALVYQDGRTNYIPTDDAVKGSNSEVVARNDFRERTDTVAEVYGHRTFVDGDSLTGTEAGETTLANAPFLAKDKNNAYAYKDGKLNHVQYGRVTSRLDDVELAQVKTGVNAGENGTKVVSYGEYNEKGTENSYFYRGTDERNGVVYNANLTSDLAKVYHGADKASGELNYQGHAVTYGFTHVAPNANKPDVSKVPNAIGANPEFDLPQLVSGTHVSAKIDLATKGVTGQLYDVWSVDNVKSNQQIANFTGTLVNNGSITGSSTRTLDNAAGTFNGNLFGKQAEELGGALASKATDSENSWGAVFGAKVQETPYQAPEQGKTSVWGVKTDGNN
ncbi:transferrin-binding protein-like solute binding protein [Pasteurella caecimuris]|uniref:transferrin-binding protein-like solute binding protein n=1 Tax=Rodentibacter caecimuris TaxID=1796644 RepID=UPI00215006D2|nr:transferrin-binding protein-like solute binding protein [Pasteurella caecimuris]MCR1837669.1 transferrin-binding protein-like solute binding protein [Pasteurella caecimuris]